MPEKLKQPVNRCHDRRVRTALARGSNAEIMNTAPRAAQTASGLLQTSRALRAGVERTDAAAAMARMKGAMTPTLELVRRHTAGGYGDFIIYLSIPEGAKTTSGSCSG